MSEMKPITRKEKIIAGENIPPITREEMFLQKYGGGGGSTVQSDLAQNDPTKPDYIKNRTHYEETTVVNEPLNIAWDGNTEGLVTFNNFAFKVSDLVLTDEQIKSATVSLSNGEEFVFTEYWDSAVSSGTVTNDVVMVNETTLFVRKDGAIFNDAVMPDHGIYFANIPNYAYVSSLTTTEPVEQTKTVVHKLDKKFLPDEVNIFKVNISYDEANSEWVSDKAYDEITAAEQARIPIVGTFTNRDGRVFTLLGCDAETESCQLSAFDVSSDSAPIIYKIKVYVDNRVSVTELALTATATAVN